MKNKIIVENLVNSIINELDNSNNEKDAVIKIKIPRSYRNQTQPMDMGVGGDMGMSDDIDDDIDMGMDDDMGNDMDMGDNMDNDMDMGDNMDNNTNDDTTKEIQSLAGKLAQQIRDSGGIDDNLKKQVQGTVDSALNPKKKNESISFNNILNNVLNELKDINQNYDIDNLVDELSRNKKRDKKINLKNIYNTKF